MVPDGLDALVAAWQADDAYEGMLSAGGIEMPADSVAVVAIEELRRPRMGSRARHRPGVRVHRRRSSPSIDDFFGQFGPEQRGGAYGPGAPPTGPRPTWTA